MKKESARKVLQKGGEVGVRGFIEFVREQGVVGLAVGFILGGAVSKLVASLVNDIINPILGIALGAVGDLDSMGMSIGGAKIAWGAFVSVLINYRDWETDRKSTRLNSSHSRASRMPSSA